MDLRANTAVDVLIGPFVDSTDGNTTEDGLTISQADVKLSKNGQALTQKTDATACAFDDDGYYNCELDATDTNTEGGLVLIVHESGALPVRHEYNVLSEAAWDSLYAAKDAGFMDVNIKTVGRADAQETEANNLESACSNYSVTRGLTGTAVPAAVADAAGGLPISDSGGLDLDTLLAYLDASISSRSDGTGVTLHADYNAAKTAAQAAKLLAYTQLLARSDAAIETDNSTELTEINADGGSGAGNFSAQTDSVEGLRDHIGDGTNLTEAGGDGDHLTAVPWNADWDAEVQSEVNDALVAYDPPTKAEMDTAHDLLATEAKQDTAQADLDIVTGADGVTLATAQGNYAPNTVVPDAAGTAPTAAEIKTAMEAAGGDLDTLINALANQGEWVEASGDFEMYNDSNVSQGTITQHIRTDGNKTYRKRTRVADAS